MEKTTFLWKKRPALYFVFNWGVPIYCSYGVMGCFEFARRISKDWETPYPEGSLRICKIRPSVEPGLDIDEMDLTEYYFKFIERHGKTVSH